MELDDTPSCKTLAYYFPIKKFSISVQICSRLLLALQLSFYSTSVLYVYLENPSLTHSLVFQICVRVVVYFTAGVVGFVVTSYSTLPEDDD
jgi:hypothetical protein